MTEYAIVGSGSVTAYTAASTTYYGVFNGVAPVFTLNTTEANAQVKFRGAGVLSKLRVNVETNTRTASTLTVRKNGADTALTVGITASTTGIYTDLSHSATYADGDTWDYSFTTGTGAGNVRANMQAELAVSGQAFTFMASQANAPFSTASVTRFFGFGADTSSTSTEATRQIVQPGPATLSNMQFVVSANARTTTTTVKSRINGADGAQAISITSGQTGFFEDASHTDAVVVGDKVNGSVTTLTGSETLTLACVQMKVTGAAPGRSAAFTGGATNGITAGSTLWGGIYVANTGTAAEARAQTSMPYPGVLSALNVCISANASTTNATMVVRVNGASVNNTVSITALTTGVFADATHADAVVAGDLVAVQASGTTTGSATLVSWALLISAPIVMTADAGSFALTGQAAGLQAARLLSPAVGAFSLSGQAAGVLAGRRLAPDVGAFSLTGQAAGLSLARRLAAGVGSFTLSGAAAGLGVGRRLSVAAGAFTLTGLDAGLLGGRRLAADAGAFVLSGADAALSLARRLTAPAGAFVLAGSDAALLAGRRLAAAAGGFALDGAAAGLIFGRRLAAATGVFVLAGQDAGLRAARRLSAAAGAFALAGLDAGVRAGRLLTAQAGAFALAGLPAGLLAARRLAAGVGAFLLAGGAVLLRRPAPDSAQRTLSVAAETRVLAVAETRVLAIDPETRTLKASAT